MKPPIRIPRLLLTNDDGFDAPGLAILAEVAREFSDDIWIIAPEHDQSGTGQSVSLNNPVRCTPRGEKQFAVSGTPADCVILGVSHLMKKSRPSIVLSGINSGSNIGDDVNLSGTIGAAFTGLMLGVPSIAISIDCVSRKNIRWDTAREILPLLLRHFLAKGWRKETCLSINIPDRAAPEVGGFSWTHPTPKTVPHFQVEQREDLREKDYFWIYPGHSDTSAKDNTDIAVLARGEVSVSALALDRSVEISEPAVLFDEDANAASDE
jgi:5'-nucleotidase